jgi:AICAR transformylase/IMP cyclohydrolase PurH
LSEHQKDAAAINASSIEEKQLLALRYIQATLERMDGRLNRLADAVEGGILSYERSEQAQMDHMNEIMRSATAPKGSWQG